MKCAVRCDSGYYIEGSTAIKFVGDGTYLQFTDKCIEIRPSGTDAKTKAYGSGEDLENISTFAKILGNYSGDKNSVYDEIIGEDLYNNAHELALNSYLKFVAKGEDKTVVEIPQYTY